MKKAIFVATLVMLLSLTMAFTGCAQEAESSNPFVGRWIHFYSDGGYLILDFSDTTYSLTERYDEEQEVEDSGTYTYSGDEAILTSDYGGTSKATISNGKLSWDGAVYNKQ
ncbi:MAG: hypothetical protein J6B81_05705 [Spirochaetaceae bacterium]|nr:hypothetical protein [Spirochaetaceae bacterium]